LKIDQKVKDRVKGSFFAAAIGDALGIWVEFLSKADVRRQYPGGLRSFDQIKSMQLDRSWEIGEWSDDFSQSVCVAQTLLACGEINPEWLAYRLKYWFDTDGRGCGRHTRLVLTHPDFLADPMAASRAVWAAEDENSNAANGALMRSFPTGLWDYWSLDTLMENTERACLTTHSDPRCLKSCLLHAFILSRLLLEPEKIEDPSVIQAIAQAMDSDDKDFMKAVEYQKDISKLKLGTKIGYTYRALSAAFWALYNATSIEQGISAIIAEGGDADTNACVAGAVLGAKFGFKSISPHLVDGLVHKDDLTVDVDLFVADMEKRI
jgi:ADP-ribosylglycohydrolase